MKPLPQIKVAQDYRYKTPNTASPPHPWIPHPQIQPTADRIHSEKSYEIANVHYVVRSTTVAPVLNMCTLFTLSVPLTQYSVTGITQHLYRVRYCK